MEHDNSQITDGERRIRPILDYSLNQYKKKRVAVYARVSRTGEMKHQSIEAQKKNLKADIEKHPGWVFAGFYVDEGFTGTKMNRPEFTRMIEDARAGKIDIIMTKKVSRFGRNTTEVLKILQELKEMDVIVIFDGDQVNTADSKGMLRIYYQSVMAEKEAQQNSENKKWSIRNRYKKGIPNTFRPYGYTLVDHKLQIVPEEAKIVKQIFKMYLSGMGKQMICKKLNSKGCRTHNGVVWQEPVIHDIIRNTVYTGDLLLQKTYIHDYISKKKAKNNGDLPQYYVQNAHEAIIDRATFEKVQQEINRRKNIYDGTNKANKTVPRLFSQLIQCSHCGNNMHYKLYHGSSERKTWVCGTYAKLGPKYCPVKPIREDVLFSNTVKILVSEKLIKKDTPITKELLNTHIKKITANENYELEYKLANGKTIIKSCKCPSRSESWTPEMKQRAREKSLALNAKRKEEENE